MHCRKRTVRKDEDFTAVLWRKEVSQDEAKVVSSVPSNVLCSVLSKDQVGIKLGVSWGKVESLLIAMNQPTSVVELMQAAKQTNRTRFKKKYLDPLMKMGILAMTQPDSPTSPTQKYYLTELGKALLNK